MTSHLTTVRTWLAGQVAQYKVGANPDFASYTQALASMLSYARMVGLPPGDSKAGAAVDCVAKGSVAADLAILTERHIAETGEDLSGRRKLRVLYNSYRTNQRRGGL